jgi:hypothetical protein
MNKLSLQRIVDDLASRELGIAPDAVLASNEVGWNASGVRLSMIFGAASGAILDRSDRRRAYEPQMVMAW